MWDIRGIENDADYKKINIISRNPSSYDYPISWDEYKLYHAENYMKNAMNWFGEQTEGAQDMLVQLYHTHLVVCIEEYKSQCMKIATWRDTDEET